MGSSSELSLPKKERLSGRKNISTLVNKGRYGNAGCLRYASLNGNGAGFSRVVVSVSKRNFKRAVKRNLLKRRIRESYRLQKSLTDGLQADIMFIYKSKEVADFQMIYDSVGKALREISKKYCNENAGS